MDDNRPPLTGKRTNCSLRATIAKQKLGTGDLKAAKPDQDLTQMRTERAAAQGDATSASLAYVRARRPLKHEKVRRWRIIRDAIAEFDETLDEDRLTFEWAIDDWFKLSKAWHANRRL
jgi:hypothetical protein